MRMCSAPTPQHGGHSCAGPSLDVTNCNTDPCPVDGQWTEYGAWGACSVTCGGGVRHRRRTCTNPKPENGGKYCEGSARDDDTCNRYWFFFNS